ncbi:MAG TPA: T9SS type A sorting domain-containing protein [Candidatus Limisoma gallistercoris]|nr:T9SS type A sorting domain-containing protein [Candidatus Limisoma gallistercoris]
MRLFNNLKNKTLLLYALLASVSLLPGNAKAEGEYAWPSNYGGVMLQSFYWDMFYDYSTPLWIMLQNDAGELSDYFDLIWVPNSGKCSSDPSNGYNPVYWFTNHNSSFGTEEELREMIATFKNFGTGIIEDVVINHRDGATNWTDFPTETYKGVTYEWGPWAICSNDEVANEAGQEKPTGAPDTGDNFPGCRDLDHTNAKVQEGVKAYLDFLKNDLGYVGWRYDMVKGYAPQYTKMYNESAKAQFSVGEYWDNYDNITRWIENTGRQSAAFDFEFKWQVNKAFSQTNYGLLAWENKETGTWEPAGVIHMPKYRRYAVTFVDNHDTGRKDEGKTDYFPVESQLVTANAFMLLNPGTPCVFMEHWLEHKDAIKQLIAIRKSVGITNESNVEVLTHTNTQYIAKVTGTNGEAVIGIGRGLQNPSGYTAADMVQIPDQPASLRIWTKVDIKSLDTKRPEVVFDKAEGYYIGGTDVTISVNNADNATVVYTTDGTTPSLTNGTKAAAPATVHISQKVTIKAAAIVNGEVASAIKTMTYRTQYAPVTVFFQKPTASDWTDTYFYAWSNEFEAADLLGDWPGKNMKDATVEQDGYTWYTWTTPKECDVVSMVFNIGSNVVQTVDVENIEGTRYFKLGEKSGKYEVIDVTDEFAGVEDAVADNAVKAYPNPATDVVRVNSEDVTAIYVYSLNGSVVAHSEGVNYVNVSGLQSGFYLYRITLADGTVAQGKIVKK